MTAPSSSSPTPAPPPPEEKSWKDYAEPVNSALNIVYKTAIGVGALATFTYLYLISFFPSGLTPGEVIFFVFVALAFSFIYALIIIFGTYSVVWAVQLFLLAMRALAYTPQHLTTLLFMPPPASVTATSKWKDVRANIRQAWHRCRMTSTRTWFDRPDFRRTGLNGLLHGAMSLFLFWSSVLLAFHADARDLLTFLLSCALSGFLVLSILEAPSRAGKTSRQIALRTLLIVLMPIIIVSLYNNGPRPILDIAFQGMGIQVADVSLELPDTEIGALERVSEIVRHPLIDCRRPQPNKLLVHGAEVLWTGVGEHSLVRFVSDKDIRRAPFDPQPTVGYATLKFETKSMNIIKSNPRIDPCFDLPSDLLFDTGKHELGSEAKVRIDALATSISNFGHPEKIVVRGHSDPRRITVGPDGKAIDNQILSERRASAIARQLDAQLNSVLKVKPQGEKTTGDKPNVPVIVHYEGYGSREPKVRCENTKESSRYELDRCNMPNRRVEVRVTYKRDKPSVPAAQD